eukprot:GEMP01021331.1.p1 GENE.GEMP01021331.1~~GEMP01021331.1.p1  ORF type:complete len:213 (+),score=52.16 GEMP01021331.1:86-724(+)
MSFIRKGWDKMMGNKSLADLAFDMKLRSKELERESKRMEKQESLEKTKVKKAIEKGNKEGAQIFAQNAIRKKTQALNFLKLSARFDAVASRLDDAAKNTELTKGIAKTVPQLERAMQSIPIEKMSENMDEFERLFEDLDVRADYIANAVDSTTAHTTPADQVDALIQQVGDEHALDVKGMLQDTTLTDMAPPEAQKAEPMDPLEARLANLRG